MLLHPTKVLQNKLLVVSAKQQYVRNLIFEGIPFPAIFLFELFHFPLQGQSPLFCLRGPLLKVVRLAHLRKPILNGHQGGLPLDCPVIVGFLLLHVGLLALLHHTFQLGLSVQHTVEFALACFLAVQCIEKLFSCRHLPALSRVFHRSQRRPNKSPHIVAKNQILFVQLVFVDEKIEILAIGVECIGWDQFERAGFRAVGIGQVLQSFESQFELILGVVQSLLRRRLHFLDFGHPFFEAFPFHRHPLDIFRAQFLFGHAILQNFNSAFEFVDFTFDCLQFFCIGFDLFLEHFLLRSALVDQHLELIQVAVVVFLLFLELWQIG
mmetsp:Transcript_6732/g.10114  ORF Transcript_6732/g.10114 Transcript_6732/m.10114 type:complete len:323 (-) Transcript_6732:267-1235(-)